MAETDVFSQVLGCILSGSEYAQHSKPVFDQLAKKSATYIKGFLTAITDISNSEDYPPHTKFYALFLLVKATETKNKALTDQLAKHSDLINKFFQDAQIEKSKPLGEKGQRIFNKTPTQEDAMIGRNYMILLFEALSYWNREFGSQNKKDPGYSFSAIHTALTTKIPLPTTFHYIGQNHRITENFHLEPAKPPAVGPTTSSTGSAANAGNTGSTPQGPEEDLGSSEAFLQLISTIPSEEDYIANSPHVFESVKQNSQKYNKSLLKSINEVLTKPDYGIVLKFHALLILAQIVETENKLFVSQFAQDTKLLNHIAKEGSNIGKTKPTVSTDRNAEVRYTKNYQVLLLELVKFSDSKYGTTDTKNPYSNFNVLQTSLSKKCTFPTEYVYIKGSKSTPKDEKKSVRFEEKPQPALPPQSEDPIMRTVRSSIASGPDFSEGYPSVIDIIGESTEDSVLKYFDGTLRILSAPEEPPRAKFYALYILTKISETDDRAFMTVFTKSKGLMDKLFQDAQFDAKKTPEQRGLTFFSKKPTPDDSVIGNNYIELLAETFRYWGENYGTDIKSSPLNILKAIGDQLRKTTKVPDQYYYIGRNLEQLNPKDLANFELIPYRDLPKSSQKKPTQAQPQSQSQSQNKPPAPKPQEETRRPPDDFDVHALEQKLEKLSQSKVVLAEFLEENRDEKVDKQIVDLLFQEVATTYNSEVLMYVDPLVDSTHPDKDKYMNIIFKEGDLQDRLDLEHKNFNKGKSSYTEFRRRALPLLASQDSPTSSLQKVPKVNESPAYRNVRQDLSRDPSRDPMEESKAGKPQSIMAQSAQSRASDLIQDIDSEDDQPSSHRAPVDLMKSRASDLMNDRDSDADVYERPPQPNARPQQSNARPPAPKTQKFAAGNLADDMESEVEVHERVDRSNRPRVVTQNFAAGELMNDLDSAGLRSQAARPKVVPQRFASGELMGDPDSAGLKKDNRRENIRISPQKFLAGELVDDREEPKQTQSVIMPSPQKQAGYDKVGQSVRISPSKDYNMEVSKIGQSIKMSKAKIMSLSNIQNSIKKSFTNVGKEPPKFKPLPDLAAMENIEDEIARLNREKEELRRENLQLRDQTSNIIEDFDRKQQTNAAQVNELKQLLNEYQDRIDTAQTQLDQFKNSPTKAELIKTMEPVVKPEPKAPVVKPEPVKEPVVKPEPVKEPVREPVKEIQKPEPVAKPIEKKPADRQMTTPVQDKRQSTIQQHGSPIIDSFLRAQQSTTPERQFPPTRQSIIEPSISQRQQQPYNVSPLKNTPYTSQYSTGPLPKHDFVLSTPMVPANALYGKPETINLYQVPSGPKIDTSPSAYRPDRSSYGPSSSYTGVDKFVNPNNNYAIPGNKTPPPNERKYDYSSKANPDHPVTYVEIKPHSSLKKSPKPASYRQNVLSSLKLRIRDTADSQNTANNYKMACLYRQNTLYENPDLKISVSASTPVYQTSKRNELNITLEYTNKGTATIRDFNSIFSDVYNVTLALKNEVNNAVIEPGRQVIQQLVFAFEEWPLQVSQLYASYKVSGRREDIDVYLPTLVTKFMSFKPSDSQTLQKKFEQESRNVIEGDEIQLNQSIIRRPEDFRNYFGSLVPLEILSGKIYSGETQFGGTFRLNWQKSDYMLKIEVSKAQTATFAILAQNDNAAFADVILETFAFLFGKE